jgi:hypothetical protein
MLRKVAEAPARPEAASSAVLRPSVLRPAAFGRSTGRSTAASEQTRVI